MCTASNYEAMNPATRSVPKPPTVYTRLTTRRLPTATNGAFVAASTVTAAATADLLHESEN